MNFSLYTRFDLAYHLVVVYNANARELELVVLDIDVLDRVFYRDGRVGVDLSLF